MAGTGWSWSNKSALPRTQRTAETTRHWGRSFRLHVLALELPQLSTSSEADYRGLTVSGSLKFAVVRSRRSRTI